MRTSLTILFLFAVLTTAAPASAASPKRPPLGYPSLPQSVTTDHFVVHYTTSGVSAIDAAKAETLAGWAETAYQWLVVTWGYPAPLDDGDGRTDIYVLEYKGLPTSAGSDLDATADRSTVFLNIRPISLESIYPVAHEFFHAIQMGISRKEQSWLDEATAEWAGQNVYAATGLVPDVNWFQHPGVPLDCAGASCADGDQIGYRGSIFFEYLDQRFGPGLVRDVYERGAAAGGGNSLAALEGAISARGTTLSTVFADYAYAAFSGGIERTAGQLRQPAIETGRATGGPGAFGPITGLVADHLSLVAMSFVGNALDNRPACDDERLAVEVTMPDGVPTAPAFAQPGKVTPLTVAGGVARGEIPWGACERNTAVLVLPNGSLTADDREFIVRATVTGLRTEIDAYPKPGRRGVLTVRTQISKPGRLTFKVTTRRAGRTRAYASKSVVAQAPGMTAVTLRPSRSGLALLRAAKRLTLTITVTLKPAKGRTKTVRLTKRVRYTP